MALTNSTALRVPKVGEVWKERPANGGGSEWRVTFVSDTEVGIAGPGPCRSYRKMPLNEFLACMQLKA